MLEQARRDLLSADGQALLPHQRRATGLVPVDVVDAAAINDRYAVAWAVLDDARRFVVPLTCDGGVWRRSEPGDRISVEALNAPAPFVVLRYAPIPDLNAGIEFALSVDMSNELLVVDNAMAAKWQFLEVPSASAGLSMAAHLLSVGFTDTPAPLASVHWNERLIMSATQFLPDAADGWQWMVDDLLTYVTKQGVAPRWPTAVGDLIGRFHNACATPSAVFPVPVSMASNLGPMVDHYRELLGQVSSLDEQMGLALEPWASRFADAVDVLGRARDVTVLPIHGDLHAGQLLRWSGGIAMSDFDGNPLLPVEHRADPGPAAFDLATLLRSIDHVAHVVARRAREAGDEAAADRSLEWSADARDELRSAYVGVVDRPLVDLELVAAFESLSPLHEAVYAATYLPRWRYVPLGVLARGW